MLVRPCHGQPPVSRTNSRYYPAHLAELVLLGDRDMNYRAVDDVPGSLPSGMPRRLITAPPFDIDTDEKLTAASPFGSARPKGRAARRPAARSVRTGAGTAGSAS